MSCALDGAPVGCQAGVVTLSVTVGPHTFTLIAAGPGGQSERTLSWTTYAPVGDHRRSADHSAATTATVTYTTENATSVTCALDGAPVGCAAARLRSAACTTAGTRSR